MLTKKDNKKLQIFVSSTYTDMLEERQAATETILKTHNIPAGMELFSSGSESQLEVIKEWIDDSDLYVLILGGRYGSLESKSQKSYTQLEYEYALEKGKPYFAIVIDEAFLEEKIKKDGKDMMEYENYQKYQEFRKLVLEKICVFYNSIDNLKFQLSTNIENTAKRYNFLGWVRGVPLSDYIKEESLDSGEINTDQTKNEEDKSVNATYSNELKELCNMYITKCKPLIVFCETISNTYPVEILSEIQNVFYHVSRIIITEKKEEIDKIQSHIYRMCIDSLKYCIFELSDMFSRFEKNSRNFKNLSRDFFCKFYALKNEFSALLIEAKENEQSYVDHMDFQQIILAYENAFNKGCEIQMLIGNVE